MAYLKITNASKFEELPEREAYTCSCAGAVYLVAKDAIKLYFDGKFKFHIDDQSRLHAGHIYMYRPIGTLYGGYIIDVEFEKVKNG